MTPATLAVTLLVVLPLLGAAVSLTFWRMLRLQQVLAVGVAGLCCALAITTLVEAARSGPIVVHMGGWPARMSITLYGDVLALLLLTISLLTILAVLIFAIGQPRADKRAFYFHPLYLVLSGGVSAVFLTGDLFNLFVAIEIMLSASYVLITMGGTKDQVRSGMTYVVINLLASTLLVTAVGLIYAATGALSMAEVAVRLNDIDPHVSAALGALLLVALGVKAAIFPLFFWLPDSYPTAPVAVTAVFAGLLTKVGVYAIIRTQTLMFPSDGPDTVLMWTAALTMVVGVIGAVAQDDMKRILSFHIVSQIGYMLFGLSLFTPLGLAAAVIFIVHQIPVKAALFLVNGLVEQHRGTSALHRLGSIIRSGPLIAVLFGVSAISLAGLPPTSGFIGKLALVRAGVAAEAWTITGVSLAVSILTLLSMTKIWTGVFWGHPADREEYDTRVWPVPKLMNVATGLLVLLTIAVAVFAEPLWGLAVTAAEGVADPVTYVEATL